MRPTFMGFEAAKTAVFANQKSLDIVGNNLSNIDTNGYTRQRVDRTQVSQNSYTNRVASNRVGLAGQGVETVGISQIRDSFLDKRFRDEYSKSSYHSQAANILSDIQSALGDGNDITDESGLNGAIKQLYNSLNDYIQDPTMDSQANIVLSAFKNITQVLSQLDAKLTNVAKQQITDMKLTVDTTNDIIAQIAHINKTISEDATVLTTNNETYRPNELLDQRNLLLDQLSQYGNISVSDNADGSIDVKMNGHDLINGSTYNIINMTQNEDQTVSIQWSDSGENVSLENGALLAYVQFINGRGANVQSGNETPEQGILYYRDRLDTFANALATVANNTVPVLDETTNKPLLDANGNVVYKTLLAGKTEYGTTNSKIPVTAGNITISDEWTSGGAGYFIYSKSERVEDYAQKLASAFTDDTYTFESYGEKFTGTFTEYEVDFLGKLGSDIKYQEGRQDATATVANDFLTRRDEISAVSQDEETADMLKYQKSYEAAARLMTALDDLIDIIINRMGRVGL